MMLEWIGKLVIKFYTNVLIEVLIQKLFLYCSSWWRTKIFYDSVEASFCHLCNYIILIKNISGGSYIHIILPYFCETTISPSVTLYKVIIVSYLLQKSLYILRCIKCVPVLARESFSTKKRRIFTQHSMISCDNLLGPLLLTWFNFNPSMDK